MKLAIVGATGLVGRTILDVLEEFDFPYSELLLVASEKSAGSTLHFKGKDYTIITIPEAIMQKPDIAIFSAGGDTSKVWAPKFAEAGTTVIDNSSAWRMDESKKLIVPEINAHTLTTEDKIIANPNCSTIQMVVALADLHQKFNLKRLVIATYQSVSGTGAAAIQQLENERKGNTELKIYPHPIDMNCLPHGGTFDENGYTTEETKLLNETRKIFNDYTIHVTATVVRVPVIGGHSEAVNAEFHRPFEMEDVMKILAQTKGVVLQDNPQKNEYPMPIAAHKRNEVFVGRLRRDLSIKNGINLWIVADNLRKGAATNAVQIAQYLVKNKLVQK